MKRVIIIGSNGQDGYYLSSFLENRNYEITKIDREIFITNGIAETPIDIKKQVDINQVVNFIKPNEVYFLAACHQSAQDKYEEDLELYRESIEVNEISLFNCLSAITKFSPKSRLFYATSRLIFGDPTTEIQDENTPINPTTIYGITKASGLFMCRKFRKEKNIFAASGILYNHESILRKNNFLSKKIINGVIRAKKDNNACIEIGNLESVVDWGFAPDFVQAMFKIINHNKPNDYIVATGEKHKVKDFVSLAYKELGMDWRDHVHQRDDIIQRFTKPMVGDASKLRNDTGWKPTVSFEQMVKILVQQGIENE